MSDPINPDHYKQHPSGVECIEVTRHMGFNVGNAMKYIWREGLKDAGTDVEDLRKAIWYLEDEVRTRLNKKKQLEEPNQDKVDAVASMLASLSSFRHPSPYAQSKGYVHEFTD